MISCLCQCQHSETINGRRHAHPFAGKATDVIAESVQRDENDWVQAQHLHLHCPGERVRAGRPLREGRGGV